jgi:hypothetical protein
MVKTPCEHTRAHKRAVEEKLALKQSVVYKGPFSGIRPDCMHTATAIAEPATVAAYYQARTIAFKHGTRYIIHQTH